MDASAPIPGPLDDDDEDVYLALSTATTLWNRGEHDDALRWLRRAAETAADADADARALELFKAAAEVTSLIKNKAAVSAHAAAAPQELAAPPAPPSKAGPPPLPARSPQASSAAMPPLPGGRRATRGAAARLAAAPPVASARAAVAVPPPAVPRSAPSSVASTPSPLGRQAVRPRAPDAPPSVAAPSAPHSIPTPSVRGSVPAPYEPVPPARTSQVPLPPTTTRSGPSAPSDASRAPAPSPSSGARSSARAGASPTGQAHGRGRSRSVDRRASAHEDETTARRDLPDLADDLDEETNIIDGEESSGSALGEAIRAATGAVSPQSPPASMQRPASPAPVPLSERSLSDDPTKPRSLPSVVATAVSTVLASAPAPAASQANAPMPHASAPQSIAPAPQSIAPAPQAQQAPAPAPQALAPTSQASASPLVTAIRVAVVVTTNLDVRIVALGVNEPPPVGAAVAILVPQSDADGVAIAKLLGVSRG